MIKNLLIVFFVGSFSMMLGCQPSGLKGLVPGRGTVSMDGQPLAGALITLMPNNPGVSRNAYATSDANGRFVLTTLKENDGVFPGEYGVIVTKYENTGKIITTNEKDSETGQWITIEESVNRLPGKYGNGSSLKISISPAGNKDLVLELDSK